jgi:hypothetical protein
MAKPSRAAAEVARCNRGHAGGQIVGGRSARSEDVRHLGDVMQPRGDFDQDLEPLRAQQMTDSHEILPPQHEVSRHWIAQLEAQERLRHARRRPRLEPPDPVPVRGAASGHVAAIDHQFRAAAQFSKHCRKERRVVLQVGSDRVARRDAETVNHRSRHASPSLPAQYAQRRKAFRQLFRHSPGLVRRIVVGDHDLGLDSTQYVGNRAHEALDIRRLVKSRCYDCKFHLR